MTSLPGRGSSPDIRRPRPSSPRRPHQGGAGARRGGSRRRTKTTTDTAVRRSAWVPKTASRPGPFRSVPDLDTYQGPVPRSSRRAGGETKGRITVGCQYIGLPPRSLRSRLLSDLSAYRNPPATASALPLGPRRQNVSGTAGAVFRRVVHRRRILPRGTDIPVGPRSGPWLTVCHSLLVPRAPTGPGGERGENPFRTPARLSCVLRALPVRNLSKNRSHRCSPKRLAKRLSRPNRIDRPLRAQKNPGRRIGRGSGPRQPV